jgi:hypothetical protein
MATFTKESGKTISLMAKESLQGMAKKSSHGVVMTSPHGEVVGTSYDGLCSIVVFSCL